MLPMTSLWDVLRRWWDEQQYAWEAFVRLQRPWEQEGPLRWERRLGTGWELHGSTLPPTATGTAPGSRPRGRAPS